MSSTDFLMLASVVNVSYLKPFGLEFNSTFQIALNSIVFNNFTYFAIKVII